MRVYLEAARPRTLPAAVAPVVVGTAAASTPTTELDPLRALLALAVALALQVAVNFANDLFDGLKGVDTAERVGPRRAVASGLIAPRAMGRAIIATLALAALAGGALALLVGPELLLVGALAIAAALLYSGGPKPYASAALGEVMVFVFFGLVATAGSAYVQDGALTVLPAIAAVPVGCFAVALLLVNNLRDIPTDEATGKRTLAVVLGGERTRQLFTGLLAVAPASLLPLWLAGGGTYVLLAALAVPALVRAHQLVRRGDGAALIPALQVTARTQLLFSILLATGFLIQRTTGPWPAS